MGRKKRPSNNNANTARNKQKKEIVDRLQKKYLSKHPKQICVIMIVKNESKIIERCLDSHLPVIDCISICDTGSTDNTKELIKSWAAKHNMPCKIHDDEFVNFSHNRTNSILFAQKSFPECDYAILPDADMILEVTDDFEKSLLFEDQYTLEQYNKVIRYWNTRLVKLKLPWHCVGVTHEFWEINVPEKEKSKYRLRAKINSLSYDDRADGGCKQNKFERDKKLLLAGLDDPKEPENIKSRYKFYLAQTLKDMGNYEESINYYQLRIKDAGWGEEVFISHYRIGTCYEQLAIKQKALASIIEGTSNCRFEGPGSELLEGETEVDRSKRLLGAYIKIANSDDLSAEEIKERSQDFYDRALDSYLESWNYRKIRTEGLYNYVRLCRELSLHREKSLKMAIEGRDIEYPKTDSLFIEYAVYTYMFDFEISIIANYVPENKFLGKESLLKLLSRNDLPENIKTVTEKNAQFYI